MKMLTEKKFSMLETLAIAVVSMAVVGYLVYDGPFGNEITDAELVDVEPEEVSDPYQQDYTFQTNWFEVHVPVWEAVLEDYVGEPGVQYLEIGLFEGGSAMWMLENVLTHPTSHLTGIDPFEDTTSYEANFPTYPERFHSNLELSGAEDRATIIKGFSQTEMRDLPLEHYDIIYIDGSHLLPDALEDLVLAWRLLEPGGVLIFDDYGGEGVSTVQPWEEFPRRAANDFYWAFGERFDLLHKDRQLILKKR